MTRLTFLSVLVVGLVLATRPGAAQQKLPTVAEVLAKLKEKRDRGGVSKYKLEFETTGFQNGQAGGNCREVWEFQIDWATGKFREAGWSGCAPRPREIIRVFDGEKIKAQHREVTSEGKPTGDGSWHYGMVTGRLTSSAYQTQWWPVFFQQGVITSGELYYPGHLVFDPDPDKFFVDAEVIRNGRKCIALRTFPENPIGQVQHEYIIDPGKEYAVVGYTYSRMNVQDSAIDIDIGRDRQSGKWTVRGWKYTKLDVKGMVAHVTTVKVTESTDEVTSGKDTTFNVIPPEGAKVGRTHLEWFDGTQDLKDTRYVYVVKEGKLVQIAGPKPPLWDRVRDHWHWFALAAGLAVAAFVGLRLRGGWRRGPVGSSAPTGD